MQTFLLHQQLSQDSIYLADLPLCQLRLIDDAQYPWFILVPRKAGVEEVYQLSRQEQHQLLEESSWLAQLVMGMFAGDKLNVAAIGNMVPQLHLHHVVRFKTDPCWPKPVWGQLAAQPYQQAELVSLQQSLKQHGQASSPFTIRWQI